MCNKCAELDRKIAHYKQMAFRITDEQTLDGIAGLIKQMTADKAPIRCERPDRSNPGHEGDGNATRIPTANANRATWPVGQRVSRKSSPERGTVTDKNGETQNEVG
jgi:hypothetical protein